MWSVIEVVATMAIFLAIDWAILSFFSLANEYPIPPHDESETSSQESSAHKP
jgi:hypothetical protein